MSFLFRRILRGALIRLLEEVVLTIAVARAKEKLDTTESLTDEEKTLVREWIDATVTEVVSAANDS